MGKVMLTVLDLQTRDGIKMIGIAWSLPEVDKMKRKKRKI
jgi:hypothetical protein